MDAPINVILATNRIQIARDGDDILLDSVTYVNVVSINPLVQTNERLDGSVPGMPIPVTAATTTTYSTNWVVELHLADGRKEMFRLSDVQNQPTWTNDAAGYENAETAIYAAFPSGGGGGTSFASLTGQPSDNAALAARFDETAYAASTGQTAYVSVDGDDGTGQLGRMDLPFLTIGAAAVSAPSVLHLFPGQYTESVSLASIKIVSDHAEILGDVTLDTCEISGVLTVGIPNAAISTLDACIIQGTLYLNTDNASDADVRLRSATRCDGGCVYATNIAEGPAVEISDCNIIGVFISGETKIAIVMPAASNGRISGRIVGQVDATGATVILGSGTEIITTGVPPVVDSVATAHCLGVFMKETQTIVNLTIDGPYDDNLPWLS